MSEEIDKNYLASLDRRITDNDQKITGVNRDYTALEHQIQEILNRINNGLSPSVNKVRDANENISKEILQLSHKIDIDMRDMRVMVRESTELSRTMLDNFKEAILEPLKQEVENKIAPVESDNQLIKSTLIYGLVGAMIVFSGMKILEVVWAKFTRSAPVTRVINEP